MPTRLLVGVAEAEELTEPRRYLLDLLEQLGAHDVAIQVAMFDDGPIRRELEKVADVRVFTQPPARSPVGRLQAAARRVSPDLADQVHDVRARADLSWIDSPDGIVIHGPKSAPLLRYVRDPAVPVITYSHHLDFSIAGLSGPDRDRLIARTDRYLVDRDSVAEDLASAGVDPHRIERAPAHPHIPPREADPSRGSTLRARHGISPDAHVVGVPPVADWVDSPDLTLGVSWALERIGRAGPEVVWVGMPEAGQRRWPVDYDIDRMGLTSVSLVSDPFTWSELVALADVVVLPIRTDMELPADFALQASRQATPILCWEGHDRASEVARWDGTVVRRGDVDGMARRIWHLVADPKALHRARRVLWSRHVAAVERALPVEVPLP